MHHYGVVVTEKQEPGDGVLHWLKRGTIVRYLSDSRVQCVTPCYPIEMAVAHMGMKLHAQDIYPEDVLYLSADQLRGVV